ncbi:M43 family zinc metalloprotease [Spirosoma endophyticum]|uniref:M43 family zinc metalloprotease n=1 Tax=Spirosoma endophyticum TaxID=662367 RepID=UPI001FE7BCAF|nr:M43 family zinc metalloprotease [Spirosoma endophyticum]
MNEDFRRLLNTNGFNTSTLGADTEIEFFLAQIDPQGNATNGITRHYYAQKSSFRVGDGSNDDVLLSQIAYWPSNQYLNIWVTNLENNYLGYTQFPAAVDTISGLVPGGVSEFIDGTIINYRAFGSGNYSLYKNYNLGRTLTHEIGHWLGLLHPNGDTPCGDDYVSDTPPTDNLNQTSSCTDLYANCSGRLSRELIENYMMYSPDACMNLFTVGQKERMRAVLQVSPRRAALIKAQTVLEETNQLTLTLLPNPAITNPTAEIQFKGLQSFTLSVVNNTGQRVYTLHYDNVSSSRITIPTYVLPKGLYLVQVTTSNERTTKRLLVQ